MKIQIKKFSSFDKYYNDTVDFLIEVGEGKYDK